MSSILRALKKLEDETSPEEGGVFVTDASGPGEPAGPTSGRMSKKTVVLFGVGLISLVIASVALMVALGAGPFGDRGAPMATGPESNTGEGRRQIRDHTPPDPPPPRAVSSAARPGKAAKPGSPQPEPAATPRKSWTSKSGKTVATSSRSQLKRQPKYPLDQSAGGLPPKETQTPSTPSASERSIRETPAPAPNRVATFDQASNLPDTGSPTAAGAEFNPPTLPTAELKLQAISWAEEPKQRIAVINGEVLNIGEQISGYQVVNIRMNDVILQQNGTTWRMIFGNK